MNIFSWSVGNLYFILWMIITHVICPFIHWIVCLIAIGFLSSFLKTHLLIYKSQLRERERASGRDSSIYWFTALMSRISRLEPEARSSIPHQQQSSNTWTILSAFLRPLAGGWIRSEESRMPNHNVYTCCLVSWVPYGPNIYIYQIHGLETFYPILPVGLSFFFLSADFLYMSLLA